jgi:hypothetical protein
VLCIATIPLSTLVFFSANILKLCGQPEHIADLAVSSPPFLPVPITIPRCQDGALLEKGCISTIACVSLQAQYGQTLYLLCFGLQTINYVQNKVILATTRAQACGVSSAYSALYDQRVT